jgi:inosine/xanthosine triphosphatase
MVSIAVGSCNPVKLKAATNGITLCFTQMPQYHDQRISSYPYNVPSAVSDQPMSDSETKQGAMNRSLAAYRRHEEEHSTPPDYAVGLEGGCEIVNDNLECFAWIAIFDGQRYGFARTSSFTLPSKIKELVVGGMELGDADDVVFKCVNSKQAGGTVGHLTLGIVDRAAYYEQAVVLAMVPFIWKELYNEDESVDAMARVEDLDVAA